MRNYHKSSLLGGVLTFTPKIEHISNTHKCDMSSHHLFIPSLLFRDKINEAGVLSFFGPCLLELTIWGGLNA